MFGRVLSLMEDQCNTSTSYPKRRRPYLRLRLKSIRWCWWNRGADRQEYLCQGQSLNLFFPAGAEKSDLHRTHFAAWKLGTKGLYYLRTETSQRAENVAEKISRDALKDYETQTMSQEEGWWQYVSRIKKWKLNVCKVVKQIGGSYL